MSARLRIAIQKSGRLAEKSLAMVEAAGFRVLKGHNELLYRVENAPIDLLRVRDERSQHDGARRHHARSKRSQGEASRAD